MNEKIAIIGLGYVGIPLAVEFGKKFNTIGYDLDENRIKKLNNSIDNVSNISIDEFLKSKKLSFTGNLSNLKECNIYIIAVPTPINKNNNPDLNILFKATSDVASILSKGDIVIYESTVYPGCTENDCVPILEKKSGLKFNIDFYCGYSPERINPGDKDKTLTKIIKITSGSNKKTAKKIDNLYKSILEVGTYPVSSIMVAEAAKIIENCQRDINIAFVNELAILFDLLKIDSKEVLDAAGSKWNFLPFKPGLVGGHCIGVDPYYLIKKAEELGYESKIIASGRKLNDSMPEYICKRLEKMFVEKNLEIFGSKILIMGITFKENCNDARNSKMVEIYKFLLKKGARIDVYDPNAINNEVKNNFGIDLIKLDDIKENSYDSILVGVAHTVFNTINVDKLVNDNAIIFDIKGIYDNKYERL